jgi:protein-S-isoprenylcysteine O-methyltransferase Ste14
MIRFWATGHLIRNQEVTTSGPYAYVRDPLYLGRLFLIVGFCIMGWGYCLILLPVGLVIFFLSYMPRKYKKEMARLEKRFGESYRDYAAVTHSLLPSLRPYPKADTRNWSLTLCLKENREQYFILIVATVSAGIAARYFL